VTLPQINPGRLQRVTADTEFAGDFSTFEELCEAVSKTPWATNLDLDSDTIGLLMIEHNTIIPMEKPKATAVKAEPEPKPEAKPPAPAGLVKRPKKTEEKPKRARKKPLVVPEPIVEAEADPEPTLITEATTVEPVAKPEPVVEGGGLINRPDRVFPEDRCQKIATPAGKPPHELKGTSRKEVEDWCEKTRRTGLDDGKRFYTKRALIYWLRYFFEMFSPEFNTAKKHIEDMYADEVVV
jgi:hypothetical protein